MLVAATGNMMTCFTIYRKSGLRTPTNIPILFLSVSDILMAVLIMPSSLVSSIKGKWIFSQYIELQQFSFNFRTLFPDFLGILQGVSTFLKITKTGAFFVLGFMSCYVPATTIQFISVVGGYERDELGMPICVVLISYINPFIYGFTNRRLRGEYLELFRFMLSLGAEVAHDGVL